MRHAPFVKCAGILASLFVVMTGFLLAFTAVQSPHVQAQSPLEITQVDLSMANC